MTIINTIAITLIYIMEPYIWVKCLATQGWKKDTWKHPFFWTFLVYYILTLMKQYVALNNLNNNLGTLLMVLLNGYMITVGICLFRGSIHKRMTNLVLFWSINYVCEMIAFLLFTRCLGFTIRQLLEYGYVNSICTLFSKVLLGICCYILFCANNSKILSRIIKNPRIIPVIFECGVFELVINAFFYHARQIEKSVWYLSFLTLQTIGVCIYFAYLMKKDKDELDRKDKIIELTGELDDIRHDMLFHVRMIKGLASRGEQEELVRYIDNTFENVEVSEDMFNLENHSVSMLLTTLAQDARKKEINFTHFISVRDFIMSTNEICSVISNILKNAMEAAEQVKKEERFIWLEMRDCPGGYVINCMNPYVKKVEYKDGSYETTKSDKKNHGRGLRIIKKTVEKYGGIMKVVFHEDCCEVRCFIRNKEEE